MHPAKRLSGLQPMAKSSPADFLVKAERCEANAAATDSPRLRLQFLKAAEAWRKLASASGPTGSTIFGAERNSSLAPPGAESSDELNNSDK